MAENGSTMMDDIILSMINEDDSTINHVKSDSDIITADEFRKLFSHPFVCTIFHLYQLHS